MAALGLATTIGSGGGDGDDGPRDPIGDVQGEWTITETVDTITLALGCQNVPATSVYQWSLTQDDNNLTIVTPDVSLDVTLDYNKIEWEGAHADVIGKWIESMDVTVATDCNSLSGTTSWSWSTLDWGCAGTSTIDGTRDSPVGCEPGTNAMVAPNDLRTH
jgi:hypothetical protein